MTLVDEIKSVLTSYTVIDRSTQSEIGYDGNVIAIETFKEKSQLMNKWKHGATPANFQNRKFIEPKWFALHYKYDSKTSLDTDMAAVRDLIVAHSISGGYWTYEGEQADYRLTVNHGIQVYKEVKFI